MSVSFDAAQPWGKTKPTALLILADGTVIEGNGAGAEGAVPNAAVPPVTTGLALAEREVPGPPVDLESAKVIAVDVAVALQVPGPATSVPLPKMTRTVPPNMHTSSRSSEFK